MKSRWWLKVQGCKNCTVLYMGNDQYNVTLCETHFKQHPPHLKFKIQEADTPKEEQHSVQEKV